MTTPHEQIALRITESYVPSDLRAGNLHTNRLADESDVIVILGDPGAGKSALLQKTALTICSRFDEDTSSARLPVYVTMQNVAQIIETCTEKDASEQAFALLSGWFADRKTAPKKLFDPTAILTEAATNPRRGLVLLFDGLDEVSESLSKIDAFLVSIAEYLRAARGRNLMVVTARPQTYQRGDSIITGGVPGVRVIKMQPFTRAGIYEFLRNWPYAPSVDRATCADRLFAELTLNPSMLDTCTNPLALTLYVNRDQTMGERRTGALHPTTRAAFFDDIVDHLLVRRRISRTGEANPGNTYLRIRSQFFIRAVERELQKRGSPLPPNKLDGRSLIDDAQALCRVDQTAEDALQQLARDTGLLVENSDGTWSFINRAFYDYFVGCYIATALATTKRQRGQLFQRVRYDEDRWAEGMFFACGILARSRPYGGLEALLKEMSTDTRVERFYPRAALEAQDYASDVFVPIIRKHCREIAHGDDTELSSEFTRSVVSVLIDYQESCKQRGRPPAISFQGQLADALQNRDLTFVQDVYLTTGAIGFLPADSIIALLANAPVDEAMVALYQTTTVDALTADVIRRDARIACLLAEVALRSALVAQSLLDDTDGPDTRGRATGWGSTRLVRGTRYGLVLDQAVSALHEAAVKSSDFPRLGLLQFVRPPKTLVGEVMSGHWSTFAAIVLTVAGASVTTWSRFGLAPAWAAFGLSSVIAAILVRSAYRRRGGNMWSLSAKVLNRDSVRELSYRPRGVRVFFTDADRSRRRTLRSPRLVSGADAVAYVHRALFWRRFAPRCGDSRLSAKAFVMLREATTAEIADIVRRAR